MNREQVSAEQARDTIEMARDSIRLRALDADHAPFVLLPAWLVQEILGDQHRAFTGVIRMNEDDDDLALDDPDGEDYRDDVGLRLARYLIDPRTVAPLATEDDHGER